MSKLADKLKRATTPPEFLWVADGAQIRLRGRFVTPSDLVRGMALGVGSVGAVAAEEMKKAREARGIPSNSDETDTEAILAALANEDTAREIELRVDQLCSIGLDAIYDDDGDRWEQFKFVQDAHAHDPEHNVCALAFVPQHVKIEVANWVFGYATDLARRELREVDKHGAAHDRRNSEALRNTPVVSSGHSNWDTSSTIR